MSRIIPKIIEAGDTIDGTNQEAFFQDLEDITADLDSGNLRDESVSISHLAITSGPILAFSEDMEHDSAGYTEDSTSYVVVGASSTPCTIDNIDLSIDEGDCIYMIASVLSGDTTLTTAAQDYYYFKFLLQHSTSTFVTIGPEFGYSFRDTTDTGSATADKIEWQRHLCPFIYVHYEDPITVNSISLVTKVEDSGDEMILHKWNLAVQIIKH